MKLTHYFTREPQNPQNLTKQFLIRVVRGIRMLKVALLNTLSPLFLPASLAIWGACSLVLLQGCATLDPVNERQEHTQAFTEQLRQQEARLLAQPLTLDDCIRIALTNNYTIRMADLDKHLAKLNKKIAFSAFLPQVAASYGYNTFDSIPSNRNMDLQMTVATISMPLFAPTTWFLYGAACDGYVSAELAANYTRQNIILQTTIQYYQLRLQLDMIGALESQLVAAHALTNRIEGLAAEGFVSTWERDQARHLAESRAAGLNHAKRQATLLRATLLQILGLNPLAPLQLDPQLPPLQKHDEPLEVMVLTALQNHPELALADRLIVARENQVRQAFANFVPTLGAFAELRWVDLSSLTKILPDLASSSSMWMAGFSAAWTVFNGFAHYNNLQIAKTERTKSQREREAAFLSVIVRVATAEGALRDTVEQRRVAESAYKVAREKFEDYDAKTKEGLLPQSEALDAQALRDITHIHFVQTTYLERMALSSLDLAMGITALPANNPSKK
jgi:outer membrane protein TolC